jgi:hypothetical protein
MPGDLGGGTVELEALLPQSVLGQSVPGSAEAVGLDDVGARSQELLVHTSYEVGLRLDEQLVALAGRNSHRLERRPKAAVKDHDSLAGEGQ